MRKLNLMTHCGSNHVTRDQLAGEATPKGTKTHRPISHTLLWDKSLAAFQRAGYDLVGEAHAVNKWGRIEDHEPECHNQYFGLMELNRDSVLGHDGEALLEGEASLVAGIRNAHDKRFPSAIAWGAGLFVCDNLAFHGEFTVSRRHTKNIIEDLDGCIQDAVQMFGTSRRKIADRHEAYKRHQLTEPQVHDILVKSWDKYDAIPHIAEKDVLREYRHPSHEEHKQYDNPVSGFPGSNPTHGSVWRLYNAFTQSLKGRGSLATLSDRTQGVHRLLDKVCAI